MAVAYVSSTTGAANRSVTVASGSDRLLVVSSISSSSVGSPRTVTYGGVALTVATSANAFIQVHYLLSPTVGTATLDVTPTTGLTLGTVVAAHYTGVGSFQASSGTSASAASLSFTPSGGGLATMAMGAVSTSHTPLTNTNERHEGANYYCDRIVASSGSITVGVSSASGPDAAGAVWLEASTAVDSSGAATNPDPTAAGTATVTVDASGAATNPDPTAAGTATVTVSASGAATNPDPTAAGNATSVPSASGAATNPDPTAAGTATVVVSASGAATNPDPTATGDANVGDAPVTSSGTPSAPMPTATGSAAVTVEVSGAATNPDPTATGNADVEAIVANPCETRQLTEAQRTAAYNQQRTGVQAAVRPFSGAPTIGNLIDYINRELQPAVKRTRSAVNDVYRQATDNAPSGNPLQFYFSESVVNGDPTVGRIRLDNATQSLATTIRVSETNARLADVAPWLDVMAGGATVPLGSVALIEAINPTRFIRCDLNTMVDQGAYWDLGVTFIESSHDNPFVEDGAVVISFTPGVAAAGATVPISALTPVAANTVIANPTGAVAAPIAFPVATNTVLGRVLGNIVSAQVVTGQVADDAVTDPKLRDSGPLSVIGRSANTTGDPADISATAASGGVLRESGSTIGFGSIALAAFPTIADDTFLANISGAPAVPSAVPLTTLAGAGLIGGADAILAVGAGTGITVTADAVSVTTPLTDGDKGDITVATNGTVWTIDDNAVTNTDLRDSGALSVIGRSANTTGDPADISAVAASGAVLRESGSVLGFGTVATAGIADDAVTNAKIRNSGALSVVGRSANSTGDPADISATAASGAVLRESGSVLGFGTIATAGIADGAVTNAKIRDSAAFSILGRATGTAGAIADMVPVVPGDAGQAFGFNTAGTALGFNLLTSVGLATDAVTTVKITDANVTLAKMADLAQARIIGRALTAGTGVPTALTGAQVADILEPEAIAWTAAHSFSAGVTFNSTALLSGQVRFNSIFSSSTVTLDDVAIGSANVVRLTGSSWVLSGMVAANSSQLTLICNGHVSATGSILIEAIASTAANRFAGTGTSRAVRAGDMVVAWYDGTSSRWRLSGSLITTTA